MLALQGGAVAIGKALGGWKGGVIAVTIGTAVGAIGAAVAMLPRLTAVEVKAEDNGGKVASLTRKQDVMLVLLCELSRGLEEDTALNPRRRTQVELECRTVRLLPPPPHAD